MENLGKVIYGFVGSGKTTLVKKYAGTNQFIDLESSDYKYDLTQEQKLMNVEKRKGTSLKRNPDFPKNYFEAIMQAREKYKYVFVALSGIIECAKKGVSYWMVFPDFDCKEEFVSRLKQRGNNETFVRKVEKNFDRWVSMCYSSKRSHCERKIIAKRGEFLEDVLRRERII